MTCAIHVRLLIVQNNSNSHEWILIQFYKQSDKEVVRFLC